SVSGRVSGSVRGNVSGSVSGRVSGSVSCRFGGRVGGRAGAGGSGARDGIRGRGVVNGDDKLFDYAAPEEFIGFCLCFRLAFLLPDAGAVARAFSRDLSLY